MKNNTLNSSYKELGVHIPEILMPSKDVDMKKWSVVACDQYTSQPEYWQEVEKLVDTAPSTLNLIFPEVYLEDGNDENKITQINESMEKYMNEGILSKTSPCFIYVDRKTSHTDSRKGLIIAVDLEKYDYNKGSQTLIRATEGTVLERFPPRIKIRENAPIELPHIMLLIDDPNKSIIEPLAQNTDKFEKLYDFDLMMDGGHITGYKIDESSVDSVLSSLVKLADQDTFCSKNGVGPDKGVLLFAVGDGNHSLATAKACWENLKKSLSSSELENHPARYALVELVNVHDTGLVFEPIHRVVFNVNPKAVLDKMVDFLCSCNASYKLCKTRDELNKEIENTSNPENAHILPFVTNEGWGMVLVNNPNCNLEVGTLQGFLDELVKSDSNVKIDYIHGEDVVTSLGSMEGNIGFYLPPMDKNDLFKTVILDGALPRKTFSMGEAEEKRFYLECRKICK